MSVSTTSEPEVSRTSSPVIVPAIVVWLPFVVALAVLLGSLWLSVGMGLKACPLCFYQRTFVMGVVAVLGIGLLTGDRHRGVLNLLALPMVVAGIGVALFHVYLELTGKLECPAGVLGIGTAPQQSLASLAVLLVIVVIGLARGGPGANARGPASLGAVVLGLLLAVASVISAPPMPPVPTKAYTTPLDMCRPPFHQQ
jgi:hypothetical protein